MSREEQRNQRSSRRSSHDFTEEIPDDVESPVFVQIRALDAWAWRGKFPRPRFGPGVRGAICHEAQVSRQDPPRRAISEPDLASRDPVLSILERRHVLDAQDKLGR